MPPEVWVPANPKIPKTDPNKRPQEKWPSIPFRCGIDGDFSWGLLLGSVLGIFGLAGTQTSGGILALGDFGGKAGSEPLACLWPVAAVDRDWIRSLCAISL